MMNSLAVVQQAMMDSSAWSKTCTNLLHPEFMGRGHGAGGIGLYPMRGFCCFAVAGQTVAGATLVAFESC
ncbi:hypothetical protein [Pseudomonas sp. SDI]|uniref:hypothetical protein n=1 Tax=Pseudomonas sp. SDI TaxID=2170734 RepID=UPI001057A2A1|nr:hypothetical protein [Pseudomonas sp. SDI]